MGNGKLATDNVAGFPYARIALLSDVPGAGRGGYRTFEVGGGGVIGRELWDVVQGPISDAPVGPRLSAQGGGIDPYFLRGYPPVGVLASPLFSAEKRSQPQFSVKPLDFPLPGVYNVRSWECAPMKTLRIFAFVALLTLTGCAGMKTFLAQFAVDPDTGAVEGSLEGATGDFHKNTGLNISAGDNSVPAIALVGGLGLMCLIAYPLQRGIRLYGERKIEETYLRAREKRLHKEKQQ